MRTDRHVVMGSRGTAIAAPGVVALIDSTPDSSATREFESLLFETLLFETCVADDLAERLASIDGLPVSFAIAVALPGATSVVVRGDAHARVERNGDPQRIEADRSTPMLIAETGEHDDITLVLFDDDDAPTGQWLTTGVIAAASVVVGALQASPRRRALPSHEVGAVDFGNLIGGAGRSGRPEPSDAPTPARDRSSEPSNRREADTAVFVIPQPDDVPVGHLRIGGRTLSLEAPIVVGRRPSNDPIRGELPQSVVVDDTMLSRHHATLFLAEGRLIVIDEGSTNGTTVAPPGAPPARCLPHQMMEVPLGATIDIGGVLSATFEAVSSSC